MVLILCRQAISKVIGHFYNFSSKVVRQATINQERVFYYNKYFPSSFCKVIFYIEIKNSTFNNNTTLLIVCLDFNQNKFTVFIDS